MVSYGGASMGPAPEQHALTHARDYEKTVPITQRQVAFFAHLLARLKDDTAREANGTVLDNSLLYLGSEMTTGPRTPTTTCRSSLPARPAGRSTGRHIAYPTKTLMSKMMLAMLKLGGVPVDEFAGMREPLGGLTT